MTTTQKTLTISIAFLLALTGLLIYTTSHKALGSAPSGLPASYATTTPLVVGPNYAQVFLNSNNPNCSSRVVSTSNTAIKLSFVGTATSTATSTLTLSTAVGVWQAASTTVAYDGGLYGCGFVGVIGQDTSSSTVTLTTFN